MTKKEVGNPSYVHYQMCDECGFYEKTQQSFTCGYCGNYQKV